MVRGDSPVPKDALDDAEVELWLGESDSPAAGAARILAVLPEEVVHGSPMQVTTLLESLLEDVDAEALIDRLGEPDDAEVSATRLAAIVPDEVVAHGCRDLEDFIDQVSLIIDDVEAALAEAMPGRQAPVAEDPPATPRALDAAADHGERFDLLLRQARHCLHRLKAYRLSKKAPGTVIAELRDGGSLVDLHYVVEFLWSLREAAQSFEVLGLPKVHIRDYLTHLYQMEDWVQMEDLVRRLRHAVQRLDTR